MEPTNFETGIAIIILAAVAILLTIFFIGLAAAPSTKSSPVISGICSPNVKRNSSRKQHHNHIKNF